MSVSLSVSVSVSIFADSSKLVLPRAKSLFTFVYISTALFKQLLNDI